jgi:hypothetical protein
MAPATLWFGPNFAFHYTPTGSSWIYRIENWFGIITRQAIKRDPSSHSQS